MLLYIETNFPLSIAKGQDPQANSLLLNTPESVQLAIPSVCYMEALSVLEDELKYRSRFSNELRLRLSDARRNITSACAQSLAFHLEESLNRNEELLKEVEARLIQAVDELAIRAETIALTTDMLQESLQIQRIPDHKDNLILQCILNHARSHPSEIKVFLSGNTNDFNKPEVREALQDAGVENYFSRTQNFLGWFQSQ